MTRTTATGGFGERRKAVSCGGAEIRHMIENGGTYPDEKSLYEPVLQAIQSGWATNKGFANYLAVITAAGRRRKTGRWSRPDVTVVARHRYKFVPGRELEVITFEIKHAAQGLDVTVVYETLGLTKLDSDYEMFPRCSWRFPRSPTVADRRSIPRTDCATCERWEPGFGPVPDPSTSRVGASSGRPSAPVSALFAPSCFSSYRYSKVRS